jgi:hypothetical protein
MVVLVRGILGNATEKKRSEGNIKIGGGKPRGAQETTCASSIGLLIDQDQ